MGKSFAVIRKGICFAPMFHTNQKKIMKTKFAFIAFGSSIYAFSVVEMVWKLVTDITTINSDFILPENQKMVFTHINGTPIQYGYLSLIK